MDDDASASVVVDCDEDEIHAREFGSIVLNNRVRVGLNPCVEPPIDQRVVFSLVPPLPELVDSNRAGAAKRIVL